MRVLGLPVDLVDMNEATRRLVDAVERRRKGDPLAALRVATLNPEMVMRAQRTPELRLALQRVGLSIPDGTGVVRELRRRGAHIARVAGIDLVDQYAAEAAARGHRLALVGAAPGVAAAAGAELERRHPGLRVVATDSSDPSPELAERLLSVGVDVVLAAYSMEGQALFLDRRLDDCGAGAGIGVGGTLDVIAGRLRRAPAPLRTVGLEWLWRLAWQPWRVRRQLDLPRFWWSARREVRTRGQ
jgi:N-acetylglucosaminyldiphosphoundecaprenol N-acetyl-beta-D-mannosaminyltransferase